jgi:hypothetical protein
MVDWKSPVLNLAQGSAAARERCAAWGYSDAAPFGGETRQCQAPSEYGCMRWFVSLTYQCGGGQANLRRSASVGASLLNHHPLLTMISHRLADGPKKVVEGCRHERKHNASKRQHDRVFRRNGEWSGGTYRISSLHLFGCARSLGSPSKRRGAASSRESPASEHGHLGERDQKRSEGFDLKPEPNPGRLGPKPAEGLSFCQHPRLPAHPLSPAGPLL